MERYQAIICRPVNVDISSMLTQKLHSFILPEAGSASNRVQQSFVAQNSPENQQPVLILERCIKRQIPRY
jgi:hypothetical protein